MRWKSAAGLVAALPLAALTILVAIALLVGCEQKPAPYKGPTDGMTRIFAFGSVSCGPCIANKPRLHALRAYADVYEFDVESSDLANKWNVTATPTYIVFDNKTDGYKQRLRTTSIDELEDYFDDDDFELKINGPRGRRAVDITF